MPLADAAREIVARIRAILRRVKPEDPQEDAQTITQESNGKSPHITQQIDVGALSIWPAKRQVTWNGQLVTLTSTEFNLLEILAKNAGQVVTKQDLSQFALGRPLARFDRSIDVHLSSVRHKLGLLPDGLALDYGMSLRSPRYR